MRADRFGKFGLALTLAVTVIGISAGQNPAKHPLSFDDLIKLHRLSAPEVSPDGKWVAYAISTPDMDANRASVTSP